VTQTGRKVGAAVDDTGRPLAVSPGRLAPARNRRPARSARRLGRQPRRRRASAKAPRSRAIPAGVARDGETKRGSKRGFKLDTRRSRSSDGDDEEERGRVVRSAAKVGHLAQQTIGRLTGGGTEQVDEEAAEQVGQAAEAAVQQVGQAAGTAVQQVGQAAAKATEQIGQAAVEASGTASWTPSKAEGAGQGRRPPSRRSGEGGSKRGTRSRSSTSKDGN
jgi:hypothetical protein